MSYLPLRAELEPYAAARGLNDFSRTNDFFMIDNDAQLLVRAKHVGIFLAKNTSYSIPTARDMASYLSACRDAFVEFSEVANTPVIDHATLLGEFGQYPGPRFITISTYLPDANPVNPHPSLDAERQHNVVKYFTHVIKNKRPLLWDIAKETNYVLEHGETKQDDVKTLVDVDPLLLDSRFIDPTYCFDKFVKDTVSSRLDRLFLHSNHRRDFVSLAPYLRVCERESPGFIEDLGILTGELNSPEYEFGYNAHSLLEMMSA
jgi:hypothetical protein